jgi:putative spermidine/putrescine transport system ATP-binding protein
VVGREAARALTGSDRAFAIRPELIDILAPGAPPADGYVQCAGDVVDVLYHGASSRLRVKVDDRTTLAVALAETADNGVEGLATGARVRLAWRPEHSVPLQD